MKYYYTDPLKAVWMAHNFGVRLVAYDKDGDMYYCCDDQDDLSGIVSTLECYGDKPMYAHPDDYGVFKPNEGDMINNDGVLGHVTDEGLFCEDNIEEPIYGLIRKGNYEIIQRNGTAFFMPEVEQ